MVASLVSVIHIIFSQIPNDVPATIPTDQRDREAVNLKWDDVDMKRVKCVQIQCKLTQ